MSRSETAEQERCAVSPGEAPASAPVIGTLQTVIGSVTITRANLIVAAPGVGHPVYEGDVLETGDDGLVAITFVDGTALHLHANGRMALDEFVCGTKESNSALIRIAKGVFGFVAGKLAAEGRLAIDTPLGQLRNRAPAVGIGSLALGVFTFALIRELKADSADIAFLDNGTIDYKDLKHGVFEIVTKGDHPQVIVVDDPTETIEIRKHGSSYSVSQLANTPEEMAQLQSAYAHAYANYQAGLNDVFIQQWQHANAQPQSTGAGGSSTSLALLEIPNNSPPSPTNITTGGNSGGKGGGSGSSGSSGSSGGSGSSGPGEPDSLSWSSAGTTASQPGKWGDASAWGDPPYYPDYFQAITIGIPAFVIINSSIEDLNKGTTEVFSLTMDGGATLEILGDNGSLIITTYLNILSGTVEANDAGATLTLADTKSLPNGVLYTLDNFGNLIATGSGATINVDQPIAKNEATGQIIAESGGLITLDPGSLDNFGTVSANGGTINFVQITVTNEAGAVIMAQNSGTLTFDQGTITNFGKTLLLPGAVIEAQTGGAITIQTGNDVVNLGTLDAASYGTITLYDNVNNSGGTIELDAGGTLAIDASITITSGTITTLATASPYAAGQIDFYFSTAIDDATINNGGTFSVANAVALTLTNDSVDNTGLIRLGVNSDLYFNQASAALNGNGAVTMAAGARIDVLPAAPQGVDTLANANNITGQGEIGAGFLSITNTGSIEATTGVLTVDPGPGPGSLINSGGTIGADGISGTFMMSDIPLTNTAGGLVLATGDGIIAFNNEDITNSGGMIQVDSGSTLTLTGNDTIDNGQLSNAGNMNIGTALTTATVLIENENSGSNIFTDSGQVAVASGSTLTLDNVVLDDDTTTLSPPGIDVASGAVLTLDDGTQILGGVNAPLGVSGGTLTIESGGQLAITSATGATLDGMIVTDNDPTKGIDVVSLLTLSDGTTISGGTLTIENTGELLITAGTGLDGASASGINTISHVTVTDVGTVNLIVSGGTLTLDHDFFSGGVIHITVEFGATLNVDNSTITDAIVVTDPGGNLNTSNSTIETINSGLSGNNTVELGTTLTLIDESVTGTIDDQGTILITTAGASPHGAIFDGVIVDDDTTTLSPPGIDVASGAMLTLDGGTAILGGGTGSDTYDGDGDAGSGTLTVETGGEITVNGSGATLDGVQVSDLDTGVGIDVVTTLTLNDGTAIGGGGNLTVGSAGHLDITAGTSADGATAGGATLDGIVVTDSNITGDGIDVASGAMLTLDGGTAINGGGSGTLTVESTGEVQITGSGAGWTASRWTMTTPPALASMWCRG